MTTINKSLWDRLSKYINNSNTILLSTHINSDGDGLGSELAMYYYLKDLNKDCRIINPTPRPENYSIIDPDNIVECYEENFNPWIEGVDLSIVFDIGDYKRVGQLKEYIYNNCKSICIDHHPVRDGNPFDLVIVDSDAPATGYLIWKYFQYIEYQKKSILPMKVANALYASVVTDTGSFKYQSTTPDTHYMAAHLLESGIKGYKLQSHIYEQRNLSFIKLLGSVINNLKYSINNKIIWIVITQELLNETKSSYDDVDGLTEFIRMIKNVEISFMILEKDDNSHRVSFRSSGNYIINDTAGLLGGGGHKFAAGAKVNNISIKDTEKLILKDLLKKIPGEINEY